MDKKIKTVFLLMLVCAIALSFTAHIFAVFPFDLKISHELQAEKNPVFASVMQWVSVIGDTWIGIVMIGAVSAFYIARRQLLEAGFILATLSNFVLTSFLKVLVARPRPPFFFLNPADIFQSINQYSFPSGHVLFFVVFFGFIAYLAWRHQTGLARIIVIAICSALVMLIGPSRVYLGAHWASDVLGSYMIGVLWLFVLILGYQLVSRKRTTRLMDNGLAYDNGS
ncbi:MAG: phosphatase PAP2 family protein [Methanoregula sp.]|jgi:undecaprenyl-diphosphatase|nr:phosphatase PAP2 family protein [Methanoregula sp.]